MEIIKLDKPEQVGQKTAERIAEEIRKNPKAILGLATGSSPIDAYKDLIQMNKEGKISFKDVQTFNLDEYIGLPNGQKNPQSYRYFMNHNLFDHIDIDINNTHVPDPTNLTHPEVYDQMIEKAGGIDLQLLGLGIDGHIGFNEPGTDFKSLTHVGDLTQSTIKANSRFFDSPKDVPTKAVSMGLGSIMKAKKIIIIAMGSKKVEAVYHLVNGPVDSKWPASILLKHPNVTVIIDKEAAEKLKDKNPINQDPYVGGHLKKN